MTTYCGQNIRKIRMAMCLSQQMLGDVIGASFVAVSNWETGKTVPHIKFRRRLIELGRLHGVIIDASMFYDPHFITDIAELYRPPPLPQAVPRVADQKRKGRPPRKDKPVNKIPPQYTERAGYSAMVNVDNANPDLGLNLDALFD